jgi:CDP-glycerol glycerophosphotransferase
MSEPQIVILAAGMGSRLGRPLPKPLTPLQDGITILERQWGALRRQWPEAPIVIVVGFKMELIMEAFPDALFVYNQDYDETNTARSLCKALKLTAPGGTLWLNGDVVFDDGMLAAVAPQMAQDQSFCCVNTAQVGEEEVKYTVDDRGFISGVGKAIFNGLGEAVGINYVSSGDKKSLIHQLAACEDGDYFERGLERTIVEDSLQWLAVDISSYGCVEVDFEGDLARANTIVGQGVSQGRPSAR